MFRLIQSVGTGVFIPTMMSTVLAVAPRAKLGTYLCVGGMMITLGPAFGPVVSGLMVSAWGWRTIFVPTLVAILLTAAVGLRYVSDPEPRSPMLLDALPVALISLGLVGVDLRPLRAAGLAAGGARLPGGRVRGPVRVRAQAVPRHFAASGFAPDAVL